MDRFLKWGGILLGVAAIGFFIFDFLFFQNLRPRMVAFEPVTAVDESKIIWTGVGFLIYLGCCAISLLRIANFLRRAKRVIFIFLVSILAGAIAILFVFSDIALLSDIGKQHSYGLSQPEWFLLYPIMVFQFFVATFFVFLNLFGFNPENLLETVVFDSNIFITAQYVGLLCGFLGLSAAALGYIFPFSWNPNIHTIMTLVLIPLPYCLATAYWIMTKLKDRTQGFFDEKQQLDVGRSAFWTLVLDVIIMSVLFILNFNNLRGVTSINWLPIFLFSSLFLFSLGNLYFGQQNV